MSSADYSARLMAGRPADQVILDLLNESSEMDTTTGFVLQKMNATIFNEMGWQYWFLIGCSTISLPLYLLILITVIIRKPSITVSSSIMSTRRLDDAFYNLIISQGLADILAIIVFIFFNLLQSLPSFGQFFMENNSWAAPIAYNNIYFFVILRSNGIMLFSVQRYLVFVRDITNDRYKKQPLYIIFMIHWGPSFVIMLPVTTNFYKSFDESGATVVSPMQLGLSSGIASLVLILNTVISLCCYVAVVGAIYRKSSTKLKQREFRLSIQVFLQILVIINCLCYHGVQLVTLIVKEDYAHTLNHIRQYYPIITTELSFVNPWTFVFLNNRLRTEMMAMVGYKKASISLANNANFLEKKSSILNNSGPRRGSTVVHISLANIPQTVR